MKIQFQGENGYTKSFDYEIKSDGTYNQKLICLPAGQKYKINTLSFGGNIGSNINAELRVEYDGKSAHHELGSTILLNGRPGWDYGIATLEVFDNCEFNYIPKSN